MEKYTFTLVHNVHKCVLHKYELSVFHYLIYNSIISTTPRKFDWGGWTLSLGVIRYVARNMQCVTWYKIPSQVIWLKILKAINYAGLINKSIGKCFRLENVRHRIASSMLYSVNSNALAHNYVNYIMRNGNIFWWWNTPIDYKKGNASISWAS